MPGTRFLNAAAQPFGYVAALFLLFMMLYTVWSVAERYILGSTFVGDTELMVMAMAYCVFIAIPAVTLQDQHVAVDLIDHLIPYRTRQILQWIGLVATFVFVGLTSAYSIQPALDKLAFGETSMSLFINNFWFRVPVLIGLFSTTLACLAVGLSWLRTGPPDMPAQAAE